MQMYSSAGSGAQHDILQLMTIIIKQIHHNIWMNQYNNTLPILKSNSFFMKTFLKDYLIVSFNNSK